LGQFLPSALRLRDELWADFMCSDSERSSFNPLTLGLMTLEHAAALAEARAGRAAIEEYLTTRFDCTRPLWQHAVLPFLGPKALFTTNYDELIEKGWRLQVGYSGVDEICLRHNAVHLDSPVPRMSLFKPHGTMAQASRKIGHGGLVITMFDYFQMIGDYKEMIQRFLSDFNQTCVLFVGYAFMDMDIGAELFRLRQDRRIPWYAVFPRDDADVRRMYEQKFGILQINRRSLDFLAELDDRTGFIPIDWKFDQLKSLQGSRGDSVVGLC
jgi:SIR2-like domain